MLFLHYDYSYVCSGYVAWLLLAVSLMQFASHAIVLVQLHTYIHSQTHNSCVHKLYVCM